jgi:hypothetical protein
MGRRRLWLMALILYAGAGILDGAHHIAAPPRNTHSSTAAALAVAFCAGLFWPLDLATRALLTSP